MTGYELKKVFQESPYMYWSGNNNQIYKALLELSEDGFVTNESIAQESLPTKKIYSITEAGLIELKEWTALSPEPQEIKNDFLIHLTWADVLSEEELNRIILDYEKEISLSLIIKKEKMKRTEFTPRSERENLLWDMINDNVLAYYQCELDWIRRLKGKLSKGLTKEKNMKYEIVNIENINYIKIISIKNPIANEREALDIIAHAGENDLNSVMISSECLSPEFFKLKSGTAGAILQKFINYSIKVVILIQNLDAYGIRFKELIGEANKNNQYCFVTSIDAGEKWLKGGKV
jgi:DNA-binding PadR family transcriptional regulator